MALRVPIRQWPLLGGDAGVLQTVGAMAGDARRFAGSPGLVSYALGICGALSPQRQYERAFDFIATNTRYADDPADTELIRTAYQQLRIIQQRGVFAGDCDDIATLAAALMLSCGLHCRFVVLGFAGPNPYRPALGAATGYTHVFTEVEVASGVWRHFDMTRVPGSLESATRTMTWEV